MISFLFLPLSWLFLFTSSSSCHFSIQRSWLLTCRQHPQHTCLLFLLVADSVPILRVLKPVHFLHHTIVLQSTSQMRMTRYRHVKLFFHAFSFGFHSSPSKL